MYTEPLTTLDEALFRTIFDGTPDAVVVADRQRIIQLVNPAFTRVFGYALEEVVGHSSRFLYFDSADHQRVGREKLSPEAVSAAASSCERFRRSDGSAVWAEVVVLRVTGADGSQLGFLGLLRDVTERRLEQERLRQSEELFVTAFANNPAAIAVTRLNGGAVLNVNDSWLAMTGETRESIVGQSARFMWPSAEEASAFVASVKRQGKLQGWQQSFLKRSGETFEAEISSQVLTMQGEPVILSTLVDISQRKRAERELKELTVSLEKRVEERTEELARARDAAQTASRAKSAFLANMSHEIRTPMNAIIGLTHIMLQGGAPPALDRERLSKVNEAAHHLLEIINGILDLSKIDAGKLELEEVCFDARTVLERAARMIEVSAREKGLEVVVDADDLPRLLRGDPTRLTQALVNLLGNAVKFTSHGAITLRCRLLEPSRDRCFICFEVHDTGPGIPSDRLERIFEDFEQLDSSTTRKFGGTGLGLAITRRIAEMMGGSAGVESQLGAGSTFWFTIRLVTDSQCTVQADGSLLGRRALVIDDLPQARSALVRLLERFGMQTEAAASGAEGLRLAAAAVVAGKPFDVWLVDWLMPDLDGIETVRQLRNREESRSTPAILVSGTDVERAKLQAASIQHVLSKPISESVLHELLLRALGHNDSSTTRAHGPASRAHLGAQVLVAEDNLINQEIARELLGLVGIEAQLVDTGTAAVERVGRERFDLILMDVQMPEMDGLNATRAIRRLPGMSDVPIVAMTASAFDTDREACLEAGMNDHLSKPVIPQELYRVLDKWLPRRGAPSDA